MTILVGHLCDLSGNNRSVKGFYIIKSQNIWSGSKNWPHLPQAIHNWKHMSYTYNKYLKADLHNIRPAGRMRLLNCRKFCKKPTSAYNFLINLALRGFWVVQQCPKACYAPVFDTVLTAADQKKTKCVRVGAGRSRSRLSAGSCQDLINRYCSLLAMRTVSRRVAGNISRPQDKTESN